MAELNDVINLLTQKLLEVLCLDITHLEMSLASLDQMRLSVINRDEEKLRKLLPIMQTELSAYANIEKQRAIIRSQLANLLGCVDETLNLTSLQQYVGTELKEKIKNKQQILRKLVKKLKNEHSMTMVFIQERNRVNKKFLQTLLGKRKQLTYNRMGKSSLLNTPLSSAIVNMKF